MLNLIFLIWGIMLIGNPDTAPLGIMLFVFALLLR